MPRSLVPASGDAGPHGLGLSMLVTRDMESLRALTDSPLSTVADDDLFLPEELGPPTPPIASRRPAKRGRSDDEPISPKYRRYTGRAALKSTRPDRPLSELTAHLTNVPVKDMHAWVHRPIEVRLEEARLSGTVKRPSNSFILYRSAYADRCREYERFHNHVDISTTAGASWAIESPAVRQQFEEWASLERKNHQIAFPDYKFCPRPVDSKTSLTGSISAEKRAKKRRKASPKFDTTLQQLTPPPSASSSPLMWIESHRDSSFSPSFGSDNELPTPEPYWSECPHPWTEPTGYERPTFAALQMHNQSQATRSVTSHPSAELLAPYFAPPVETIDNFSDVSSTDGHWLPSQLQEPVMSLSQAIDLRKALASMQYPNVSYLDSGPIVESLGSDDACSSAADGVSCHVDPFGSSCPPDLEANTNWVYAPHVSLE